MSDMSELYTVFVDGELWVNVVDDIDGVSEMGGIIFLNMNKAKDFVANLRTYDEWRYSDIQILRVAVFQWV